MAAKAGPRLVVTFNPGSSPPPSYSDEEALEANFNAGVSPFASNAPRSPLNHSAWKMPSNVPFATIMYIVRSPTGLQCLLCNGSSDETINSTKWALEAW